MKTIAITGAYGALGSQILNKLLLNNSYHIIALVKSTSDSNRLSGTKIKNIEVFETDRQKLGDLFKKRIDGIIHTATLYGKKEPLSELIQNNILFPIELLELAKLNGVSFFINTDSYFTKFEDYEYLGNYSLSKKHLEDWLKKQKDIKVFNLKLEHIYSGNDTERKFVNFVLKALYEKRDSLELTSGTQKRDFIHIDDVVEFYLALIDKTSTFIQGFYQFEIGTGYSISIKNFVLSAKKSFENDITEIKFGALKSRKNEIKDSKADLSKIPSRLNWEPKIGLDEGLKLIKDSWGN